MLVRDDIFLLFSPSPVLLEPKLLSYGYPLFNGSFDLFLNHLSPLYNWPILYFTNLYSIITSFLFLNPSKPVIFFFFEVDQHAIFLLLVVKEGLVFFFLLAEVEWWHC